MKILTVHNYTGDYACGGEGMVFEQESDMLRSHGHEVCQLKCTNDDLLKNGLASKVKAYIDAPWSQKGYDLVKNNILSFKPDVIHFHNFFLVLSPKIFKAASDLCIPSVVTLHNYRWCSPCSQLLRNGKICEKCLGKNPWRIMLHRCYKNSFIASYLRYRVYYSGKKRYGWTNYPDAVIALSEFAKSKYIEAGVNQCKIYVKPNFIKDPLKAFSFENKENYKKYAVFVGRLSVEKGVNVLLKAWKNINYPLVIVGGGPEEENLRKYAPSNVTFAGEVNNHTALEYIYNASFFVFTSICYEGFPMTLLEAASLEVPAVATNLGARSDIINDEKTGFLYEPYDNETLVHRINFLVDHPEICSEMGKNARLHFLEKYQEESNYSMLIDIYRKAMEHKSIIT